MLTKRPTPVPAESFALMKDGQKIPPSTKLSAAGIKGAVRVWSTSPLLLFLRSHACFDDT
jgi:hypothetical protein